MGRPPIRTSAERGQADPGVSNDPQSNQSGMDPHIWTTLNQIFERLGKLDQKLDRSIADQATLKDSVEKHDKLIMRAVYTVGGAIAVLLALWFIYENFLKGHVTIS